MKKITYGFVILFATAIFCIISAAQPSTPHIGFPNTKISVEFANNKGGKSIKQMSMKDFLFEKAKR